MSKSELVLCSHCSTVAVAELEGDYLCSGCLMSVLMCSDELISVRRLETPKSIEDTNDPTIKLSLPYVMDAI